MKTKKSKNANLESKRGSFLMIGLVCASSFALMSFEYAKFNITSKGIASTKVEDEPFEMFTPPEIIVPMQQQTEKVELNEEEIIVAEPDPIPEPTPDPVPVPPVDPIIPPIPGPPPPMLVPTPEPIIDNEVYQVVEQMPEFPGGQQELYKYLGENLEYPEYSKEIGSQGKAYVQFTVEKDGSITDVKVVKSVDKLIDAEAKDVVENMPKWTPGKQLNKAVRVSFVLPIVFTLEN